MNITSLAIDIDCSWPKYTVKCWRGLIIASLSRLQ